jgi:hypothetical protein
MAITTIAGVWYSENQWLAFISGLTRRMISVSPVAEADPLQVAATGVDKGPVSCVSRVMLEAPKRLVELYATCCVSACKDSWRLPPAHIIFGYYLNMFSPHLFAGFLVSLQRYGL